ncbi:MAG: histidine kinase [Candidatus Thiodiazotropha taylori]|uniref:Sensor protein n=1 Tax=Candidatus Thiodiazotropha taylori TaxID=2792791 RepID=A0A9E4NIM4_9GAMM|nr:histidine kinase [Candidatus Thiodiazotropha endolucinida]MCG7977700.1 histidine kinase [Candidatus Thiodiazotropha taylori]MCG8047353.1 histidine kinase [Candidatus Thiodiazotropha taylori]MCG8060197.1 histidine kinase [Candidatus Thiodiazotropha taylori]MCW4349324.1 histidine kinase [Candidatus Thiodiazotropha endolucinida]
MQVEEEQLSMNKVPDIAGGNDRPQDKLTWIEGLIDSKHWPSLRILFTGNLLLPISILGGSVLASLFTVLIMFIYQQGRSTLQVVLLLSITLTLFSLILVLIRLRSQLLHPLSSLEQFVNQVCQGEPVASKGHEQTGVLSSMARDIDSLSEELTDIYEDMEVRVARQTARLAQKTTSLQVLYDVAAGINQSENLDELLLEYMGVFKRMVNARSATVHLVLQDDRVRQVGCIDLQGRLYNEQEMLPIKLCQCGIALSPGDILCSQDARVCSRRNNRTMYGANEVERVSVPMWYHGDVLGFYHLYVDKPGIYDGREDVLDILNTIGSHLGMAVAKQRSDSEARRLSIVEERTSLAHELHDSLAQTIASLRFQVRMLEETLQNDPISEKAVQEAQRIHNGLDEAHDELRELINSFRAPFDQRGLVPALSKLVERFNQETGIPAFFQPDCLKTDLDTSQEMQALRIVQEALANIRKHAKAHTIRVLLRCRSPGSYLILVEDDGVGFEGAVPQGNPGEHIGLSIMEERARRVGGELSIESEPGEGTRVELVIRNEKNEASLQR